MADSAAVKKEKAAIAARGRKRGFRPDQADIDATYRRNQARKAARAKAAGNGTTPMRFGKTGSAVNISDATIARSKSEGRELFEDGSLGARGTRKIIRSKPRALPRPGPKAHRPHRS